MKEYIRDLVKDRERSIEYKENRLIDIYRNTKENIINKGFYEVVEPDGGGMRDIPIFTVEITKPINQKDLALKLYKERGYMGSWNRLEIRSYKPEMDIKI